MLRFGLIQGTRPRRAMSLTLVALAAALTVPGGLKVSPASAAGDPTTIGALDVVDAGTVYANANVSAFRPALTRAPNGDFLVAFDTIGDVNDPQANTKGEVWVTRSTDGGQTWGEETLVAEASHFENGVIYSSRGMTTLQDGTILLPYNEGVTISAVNNRDSLLFIARSQDNGQTWTGTDTPITLPVQTREMWSCCSRILQLDDGSLMLSMWGTLSLTSNWTEDPMPWRAVTMKSYDQGHTWKDFRTVAWDAVHPPYSQARSPLGVNEPAVVQLKNGRLVAILRYGSVVGSQSRNRVYQSVSDDRGLTWSEPVATTLAAQTPSLTLAPCTAALSHNRNKLLFGYRDVGGGTGQAQAAVAVSFDDGLTFTGKTYLQEPSGTPLGQFISAEPDFWQLDERHVLTLFQYRVATTDTYKLGFNILQDTTGNACKEEAKEAERAAAATRALELQRVDADNWPYGYARSQVSFAANTRIEDVASAMASAVTCNDPAPTLQLSRGHTRLELDQNLTLAEAGVRNGDVITVSGAALASGTPRVGIADWDDFPGVRSLYGWSDACGYTLELDSQTRSLGLEVTPGPGERLASVSLRDSNGTTRLTTADYSLWTSADNETYLPLTGWSMEPSHDSSGRIVHTFANLGVTDRYIKIHQRYATGTPTFVLADVRSDVTVTYGPTPA